MRFLADENIPGDAVTELETAGHDIVWVRTVAPGSKDEDILALAVREERIILTFDKDFGELAWRTGLPYRQALYYFGYRCRHQPRSALFLPQGSANALIGLGTLR